jgi:energy-coupling factor transporter ATP-binding protein EcfA2
MTAAETSPRIERMVVIAGPSGCGKSTLIKALKKYRAPEIARRLEILDASEWPVLLPMDLAGLQEGRPKKLFLHYDLVRQFAGLGGGLAADREADGFALADRVDILTLWCPPDVLRRQHETAKLDALRRRPEEDGPIRERYLKVREFYADPRRVIGLYRAWFGRLEERAASHAIVGFGGGARFYTLAEWEEAARACLTE